MFNNFGLIILCFCIHLSDLSLVSNMAKLFIGFEMECPLGHRFFIVNPNEPMDGILSSKKMRKSVDNILESDIPIYMICPCSTNKRSSSVDKSATEKSFINQQVQIAQLMRVYIALPKKPIYVKFQPLVRFSERNSNNGTVFHMGPTINMLNDYVQNENNSSGDHETKLQLSGSSGYVYLNNSNIWVIRFPFAYQEDDKLFPRPMKESDLLKAHLSACSISVHEL